MANNTAVGVRKSQFNASTTISDSATFDFVEGGANKKITFENLVPLLGATGTIVQVGDVAGSPVLDIQGIVNGIRNLVGGAGVDITITAQNGLEISTSFTFDETGEALVTDPSSQDPDFKSITAGQDVILSSTDDTVIVAVDRAGISPNNRVIVNSPADFPPAVSGVRTLAASTEYLIGDDVSIGSDRFLLSAGTVITGIASASSITSTTTGALLTGSDLGFITIRSLHVSIPNGSLFDIEDNTQGTSSITMLSTIITACNTLGSIGKVFAINFQGNACLSMNDGLDISAGQVDVLSVRQFSFISTNASCKFLDLVSATFTTVEIRDVVFNGVAGAIGISGLANNGNITANSIALVESCEFLSPITPLENITVDDFRWGFADNSGVPNTMPDALLSVNNNATVTVIPAVNTPTLIAGTWVSAGSSHFTNTAAGRATYNGERDLRSPIDIVVSMEPVSGTNKDLALCIAINGVTISETSLIRRTDSGNPGVISTLWQHAFQNGDYVEAFIENRTDAVDILVLDAIMRLR